MNCQECEKNLSRYIDEELSLEQRGNVETHLAACASCREAYRTLSNVWDVLEEIPGAVSDHYFYTRLRSRMSSEAGEARRREGLRRLIISVSTVAALVLGILMGSIVGANGTSTVVQNHDEQEWATASELDTLNDFPATSVGNDLLTLASLE